MMSTIRSLFILLLLIGSMSSCNKDNKCISGQGEYRSKVYSVGDFKRLSVSGSDIVYISKGDDVRIEIEAQENIHDRIELDLSGDRLIVGSRGCLRDHKTIIVHITMPDLLEINLSGSSVVTVLDTFYNSPMLLDISGSGSITQLLEGNELTAKISGSGLITTYGTVNEQDISISGSGTFSGFNMPSQVTSVSLSGSGVARVDVSARLDVSISGSGSVFYKGNPPIVNSSISGSGTLVKM